MPYDTEEVKVYVVMDWHCGDCGHLRGVYVSKENAERRRAEVLAQSYRSHDDVTVEPMELRP